MLRKKGLNSYHFDCSNFNKANDDLSVPKKCPKFPIESIGCQMKKRREGQYDGKSTRSPKVIRIARGGSRTRYPRLCYLLLCNYTVSELEVRNLKRLEMIEKQNNFDITCLYLQEYKKEFAFLTKFHYFYHKKLTNLTFERRKKN